jgi:hypothetical protein
MRLPKNFDAGDVLYVEGVVDSMLYNILKEPGAAARIKRIELNSPGGSLEIDYPYLIAEIIRQQKMTTSIRSGAICGSSCTILFQAGALRLAASESALVYHGVQVDYLENNYRTDCLGQGPNGKVGTKAECAALKAAWLDDSRQRTERIFRALESYGAKPSLYATFLRQPKDKDWLEHHNVFGIKEWWLPAEGAVAYGVVQKIVPYL